MRMSRGRPIQMDQSHSVRELHVKYSKQISKYYQ